MKLTLARTPHAHAFAEAEDTYGSSALFGMWQGQKEGVFRGDLTAGMNPDAFQELHSIVYEAVVPFSLKIEYGDDEHVVLLEHMPFDEVVVAYIAALNALQATRADATIWVADSAGTALVRHYDPYFTGLMDLHGPAIPLQTEPQ